MPFFYPYDKISQSHCVPCWNMAFTKWELICVECRCNICSNLDKLFNESSRVGLFLEQIVEQSGHDEWNDAYLETFLEVLRYESKKSVRRPPWEVSLSLQKHGNDFANSPARKLSQSFSLDVIGGKPITAKQVDMQSFERDPPLTDWWCSSSVF